MTEKRRLAQQTNLTHFLRFWTRSQLFPVFRLNNFLVKKQRNGAFRGEKSQLFLYPSAGMCGQGKNKPDFLEAAIISPAFDDQRVTVNRLGKDLLMDDCLADAMAYQGRARQEISRQMQEAILFAAIPSKEALDPAEVRKLAAGRIDTPLVIFTSSLGSKIGFDAIKALDDNKGVDEAATAATVSRTMSIFMAANQLPILQLADQTLSDGLGASAFVSQPKDSLQELLDKYSVKMQAFQLKSGLDSAGDYKKPTVVVLSDPNDILSYSWRNAPNRQKYVTVDIVVSNDKSWFNLFENPATAHLGYLEQPYVTDIVMNGYSKEK